MDLLEARQVPSSELDSLDATAASLPEGSHLGATLETMARTVRAGGDVVVVDVGAQLTPTEAAKVLGMSRTHLYKLLDAGAIPEHRVGRDRRIDLEDVMRFRVKRAEDRKDLASRFEHASGSRAALVETLANAPLEDTNQ